MTYNAGIIGTGGIAGMGIFGLHDEDAIGKEKIRASHAGGFDACDRIELTAIADVDGNKLNRFGEAWDIPPGRRYDSHTKMLADESLDVVSVCTPSYLHHEHVIDAATSDSGPDVIWCEKPIGSRVTDARRMIDVCDEENVELLVNHSFRFTDKLQQLRSLVRDQGVLGEVHSVSAQFRMELLRNSTHLLDTVLFLLDANAERVSGYVNDHNEVESTLDVNSTLDDAGGGGFVLLDDDTFVTVDCTVPRDHSSLTIQLIGSEGKLYMNNDDGEWRYWHLENGTHVESSLPGLDGSWSWNTDYADSFVNAADHVQELLDGTAENRSTGREALRSLEIIVAFYISDHTAGQIQLPLNGPLCDVGITSW